MPSITYVRHDGETTRVEVAAGTTLKDGALENGVEGILAECGGNAMCATCHVFVAEPWAAKLPERDDVEDELLDSTMEERRDTSRLSCQVIVDEALDGMVVHIPEVQE